MASADIQSIIDQLNAISASLKSVMAQVSALNIVVPLPTLPPTLPSPPYFFYTQLSTPTLPTPSLTHLQGFLGAIKSSGTTPPPPVVPPPPAPSLSPDGTVIIAPSGSIITSQGTWTFGSATAVGGNALMLNGTTKGFGHQLYVIGANLYTFTANSQWYLWNNTTWVGVTPPRTPVAG